MFENKKLPAGGLLLAGLAAFAYYKYSRMTSEEKENLLSDLKAKGQKIFDEYVPEQYKSMFSKKEENAGGTSGSNAHFDEANVYN